MIEEQLQPNSASGSSALEHDETYLYSIHAYYSHPIELNISDPLPLDVAVIDASILLYSTMFICVSNKYRLNML
ncbi:unnamed protein product [Rotaria sp. Silwood1]|nr:unnamed protein product [Rotaria sp. Silwood1]